MLFLTSNKQFRIPRSVSASRLHNVKQRVTWGAIFCCKLTSAVLAQGAQTMRKITLQLFNIFRIHLYSTWALRRYCWPHNGIELHANTCASYRWHNETHTMMHFSTHFDFQKNASRFLSYDMKYRFERVKWIQLLR